MFVHSMPTKCVETNDVKLSINSPLVLLLVQNFQYFYY